MTLMRHIRSELIKLAMDTRQDPELTEDPNVSVRYLRSLKEEILEEIVDLFDGSGQVGNRNKLLTDLVNRERKASTALGNGVAVPHVRTKQAKTMLVALLRSTEGIYFDAPDEEPVHFFFAMVAPPYEDQTYLKLYRSIAKLFSNEYVVDELKGAENEGELRRVLRQYI